MPLPDCSNIKFPGDWNGRGSNEGTYGFTRNVLGEDHAFLSIWALELAYISLLWAKATAFFLIGRYVFEDILQWGYNYPVGILYRDKEHLFSILGNFL